MWASRLATKRERRTMVRATDTVKQMSTSLGAMHGRAAARFKYIGWDW